MRRNSVNPWPETTASSRRPRRLAWLTRLFKERIGAPRVREVIQGTYTVAALPLILSLLPITPPLSVLHTWIIFLFVILLLGLFSFIVGTKFGRDLSVVVMLLWSLKIILLPLLPNGVGDHVLFSAILSVYLLLYVWVTYYYYAAPVLKAAVEGGQFQADLFISGLVMAIPLPITLFWAMYSPVSALTFIENSDGFLVVHLPFLLIFVLTRFFFLLAVNLGNNRL